VSNANPIIIGENNKDANTKPTLTDTKLNNARKSQITTVNKINASGDIIAMSILPGEIIPIVTTPAAINPVIPNNPKNTVLFDALEGFAAQLINEEIGVPDISPAALNKIIITANIIMYKVTLAILF